MARYAYKQQFKAKPPQPSVAPPEGQQTLRGAITRITFRNDENGYTIARMRVEEEGGGAKKGDEIVVTGPLPGITDGETLEVAGQWSHNDKFGYQFAVESYKQVAPATREGIAAFLASGMIPGIGKEYARRIVQAFGDETLDVIDTTPDRLHEVEGIGPKRFETITEGWKEHREIANIMAFLQSYGISSNWATRIYRYYGEDAVGLMKRNPYRLAIDLRGMGFKSADKIAREAGVPHDSPERAQAGVLHLLREGSGKGHTFLPFDELTEEGLELLGIDDPLRIRAAVATLCKKDETSGEVHTVAEVLPEGDKAVYLKGLHHAETNVAAYVEALLATGKTLPRLDPEAEITQFESDTKFELAGRQRDLVRVALKGGLSILTGGPGTGKTTTLRAVIHALKRHDVPIALAAPTGRAAKRLSETTRTDAATIHRLLKFDPKKGGFAHNEHNPLTVDYVIVDEASMLDIALAHQLLKAIPPTSSLLLVGDVDQLPSVGPGNVLRDLIDSDVVPVVRLDTIFRQAQRSLIVRNAHKINEGEFPILPRGDAADEGGRKPDFFFVGRDEPEEALETIVQMVAERIPSRYTFDPIRDIQVITPMHRGALGAGSLNERLQATLNRDPRTLVRGSLSIRVGDKVMQTENDYDKDVYNGDIGIVHSIDRVDHMVAVRFYKRIVAYKYTELDQLTLSYAITVHKSQGSEYPVVVIPIHTQHFIMLQRNLLYTGITRGKKLVVLVGTVKALSMAIKNAKLAERHSGLRQRLQASPFSGKPKE